jgi:hypothetical protein
MRATAFRAQSSFIRSLIEEISRTQRRRAPCSMFSTDSGDQ